jgi:hypothetical protein
VTPASWTAAFTAYRQQRNALSPDQAKPFALKFTDADWAWVENERGRWESVTDRSSIARDSLKVAAALLPFKPQPPFIPVDPPPDPSEEIAALVTQAGTATKLVDAVAPLGSAVRQIDGRVRALEAK